MNLDIRAILVPVALVVIRDLVASVVILGLVASVGIQGQVFRDIVDIRAWVHLDIRDTVDSQAIAEKADLVVTLDPVDSQVTVDIVDIVDSRALAARLEYHLLFLNTLLTPELPQVILAAVIFYGIISHKPAQHKSMSVI